MIEWTAVIVAVIGAIPPTILAWAALRKINETRTIAVDGRAIAGETREIATQTNVAVQSVSDKTDTLHREVNGRLTELIEHKEKTARQAGRDEERDANERGSGNVVANHILGVD